MQLWIYVEYIKWPHLCNHSMCLTKFANRDRELFHSTALKSVMQNSNVLLICNQSYKQYHISYDYLVVRIWMSHRWLLDFRCIFVVAFEYFNVNRSKYFMQFQKKYFKNIEFDGKYSGRFVFSYFLQSFKVLDRDSLLNGIQNHITNSWKLIL